MWEIMTLARRPPHYQMTTDQIFHTLVTLYCPNQIGSGEIHSDYSHLQVRNITLKKTMGDRNTISITEPYRNYRPLNCVKVR